MNTKLQGYGRHHERRKFALLISEQVALRILIFASDSYLMEHLFDIYPYGSSRLPEFEQYSDEVGKKVWSCEEVEIQRGIH